MEKRTFLKLSSAILTGSMLSPLSAWRQREKLKNWAGNYEYSTDRLYFADSFEEVPEMVKQYKKLKVLGTRHCFNGIADSTDNFISLKTLDKPIVLNREAMTVTVGAGLRYGQLAEWLHGNGYALHNLASLPHISIAGACVTGTHGSGVNNANLSSAVEAMEFVTASGEIKKLSRQQDGEAFSACVVNLGGIGVITKITLNIQPTYMMRQDVFQNLPLKELENHFDEIMSSGYSVSLFTDWQNEIVSQVWIKRRMDAADSGQSASGFWGAKPATRNLHPIVALSSENCTEQMGVPGPWHERLPHFKMNFTPSSGKELQSEYFVPRENSYKAILAVSKMQKLISPHLLISEIRTIKEDHFWMSPCLMRPSTTIHFTWKKDWPSVRKLLPLIEEQLEPFHARPHWGKLFTMSPARLKFLYVKLPEFQQLLRQYDTNGKFRNAFLNKYLYQV